MKEYKTVACLTEDATRFEDSIQLHYNREGLSGGFLGPPADICPPIEKLRKGTEINLFFDQPEGGTVLRVELARGGMTIDEAIEELEAGAIMWERHGTPFRARVLKLGAEGLKRIRHDREAMQATHILLLPGETIE